MTCDGGSAIGEEVTYSWYKDKRPVHSGKYYTIQSAETSQSGNYQCETRPGERSDPARLDVSNGWLILQTPLHVYEGDEITIRCHHYPGYDGGWTIYYKDYSVIRDWADNAEYYIGNVTRTTAGTYGCRKEVYHRKLFDNLNKDKDETYVSVEGKSSTIIHESLRQDLSYDNRVKLCPPEVLSAPKRVCLFKKSSCFVMDGLQTAYSLCVCVKKFINDYVCCNESRVERTPGHLCIRYPFWKRPGSRSESRSHRNIRDNTVQTEGDPMTLTCETSLSPYRQTKELQFAFYREGQNIQGFNTANKYGVQSVQMAGSGRYFCEVTTSDERVRKRSNIVTIIIKGEHKE
ncbi:hypothetical protein PRIEUP_LOCUS1631, partial [Pristimantis euphronides]